MSWYMGHSCLLKPFFIYLHRYSSHTNVCAYLHIHTSRIFLEIESRLTFNSGTLQSIVFNCCIIYRFFPTQPHRSWLFSKNTDKILFTQQTGALCKMSTFCMFLNWFFWSDNDCFSCVTSTARVVSSAPRVANKKNESTCKLSADFSRRYFPNALCGA